MSILLIFAGTTLLWVATHGTEATTPWEIFQQITEEWQEASS